MAKIDFLSLMLVAAVLGSCAVHRSARCERSLSREEIIDIAREEIKKRDGDPESIKTSTIKIKRDGCDYIYYQVFSPERPGGYLFVRINESGQVIDYMPGS